MITVCSLHTKQTWGEMTTAPCPRHCIKLDIHFNGLTIKHFSYTRSRMKIAFEFYRVNILDFNYHSKYYAN